MATNATLKILGCGTSTGVPLLGCQCIICNSNSPFNKRLRTSAWITTNSGLSILIDCGPDFRQQALLYNIKHIDAVLFTHSHADHILGIDDLRAYNFLHGLPIPCYASQETREDISRLFYYIFNPDRSYQGGKLTSLIWHDIVENNPFEVFDITIRPIALKHGNLSVLGFQIGNLVYATDCNHIPITSRNLIKNSEYLIIDALRNEPHPTHFTIPEAVNLAKELGVKNTYLTHLTHTIDYTEVNSNLPNSMQLCYDGLEINFTL